MQLRVYSGEQYERGKIWLISMLTFVIIFIIFLFFHLDFIGIILFLIAIGGYIYVYLKSQKIIYLTILDDGLKIGDTFISWANLDGFVLEFDKINNKIKNIVLIKKNGTYEIFTINDTMENLESFYNVLIKYIPVLDSYNMNLIDRIIRLLKL